MSFLRASLIPTTYFLILSSSSLTLSSNYLHCMRDTLTVATSFSGPQAAREALLFAGTGETFLFLASDLEHGLHCSFEIMLSKITLQFGERNVTSD
jgi:hypothetical protein